MHVSLRLYFYFFVRIFLGPLLVKESTFFFSLGKSEHLKLMIVILNVLIIYILFPSVINVKLDSTNTNK
jgi:hypothetical protein